MSNRGKKDESQYAKIAVVALSWAVTLVLDSTTTSPGHHGPHVGCDRRLGNLLAGYTGKVSSVTPSSSSRGLRGGPCTTQQYLAWRGMRWAVAAVVVGLVMGWICFRCAGPISPWATLALRKLPPHRHSMESFLPRGMRGFLLRLSARSPLI